MTEKQITYWTWTARVLALLGLFAGVLAAAQTLPVEVQHWAALAVALLGVGNGWINGFLPARKPKVPGVAIFLLAVALMLSAGCKAGPYAVAWRTLDGIQRARDLTAQQLAQSAQAKHRNCLKAHTAKTRAFAACVEKHRMALDYWRQIARPSINAAVQVTATAVQIAERARDDPGIAWTALVKPALCALSRSLRMFGHLLSDGAAAVLRLLPVVEGMVCDD